MHDTRTRAGRGRRLAPIAFLAAVALAGCGQGYQPVSGRVVWKDGTPAKELSGSQVVFESAELKMSARGTIGPDGSFTITTVNPDDGVPAGTYKVAIVEERKSLAAEGSQLAPGLLDVKYYDLNTSGLTADVTSGKNEVTLTVERAKGRR
jgi:hypothetical protein